MSRRRANAQRKPADRASVRPSSRRIGRVSVILAALIAVAAGIWMAARLVGRSESSRANILLITIDTLRWDRVGVYGYRRAATPVLDGLAASNDGSNDAAERAVAERVKALCARFPVYRA